MRWNFLVLSAALRVAVGFGECEDSPDSVIQQGSEGLLMSCTAGAAFCDFDARLPDVCPLTCGKCTARVCEDSPDSVIQQGSEGLLMSCTAGAAFCDFDARLPDVCPLTCGKCTASSPAKPVEALTVPSRHRHTVSHALARTRTRALAHMHGQFAVSSGDV
jgi:hypothetical protein